MTRPIGFVVGDYLIPSSSKEVLAMIKEAEEISSSSHFLYARIASVGLIIIATIASLFNGLSYIVQIPLKIPLNIVQFNFLKVWTDPFYDLVDGVRSFAFIPIAISFALTGIFSPSVFIYLKPTITTELSLLEKTENLYQIALKSNGQLEIQLAQAEEKIKKLASEITRLSSEMAKKHEAFSIKNRWLQLKKHFPFNLNFGFGLKS